MSSKSANNSFAKSMNLIDAYLFKHGHILPCGHHAEEGDAIDKACSMGGCGAGGIGGSSAPAAAPVNQWGSAPGGGSMGIHATNPASSAAPAAPAWQQSAGYRDPNSD
jgi:hypothetical protein